MRNDNAVKGDNSIVHAYESNGRWHVISMQFDDNWNQIGEVVDSSLSRGLAISSIARKTGLSVDLKTVAEIRENGRNNAKG